MKRILVTGATGFLGGIVVRSLLAKGGAEVRAACRDRSRLPAGFAGEVEVRGI